MAKIYYNLIKASDVTGYTIEQVPSLWREETQKLLDKDAA